MHKIADKNLITSHGALVLAAFWLTLLLTSSHAQTGTSTVRGKVVDELGTVVAGATVTLRTAGKDLTRTQTTNDEGNYVFQAILPATYIIQVEAPQFKKVVVTGVNSEANLVVEVNIKLETYRSEISKDTPARARVTDIKPPIVKVRPASFVSMCGSQSYLVKDATGGYFMFTTHTEDMPHPLTVDNPLLSPENSLSIDPASTFTSERPLGGTEQELLVKLLLEWRDSAISKQKQRMFRYYAGLKDHAAANKVLDNMSEADSDLLAIWFLIPELEKKRK